MFAWREKRAAWKAILRCHGVPYLTELSSQEHHGMLLLERSGEVHRDEGALPGRLHWHLTDKGRERWYERKL